VNKPCLRCKKANDSKAKTNPYCKLRSKELSIISKRKKNNLPSVIYNKQKMYSRKRKHPRPSYSKLWLAEWLDKQPLFHTLYDSWVASNYESDLSLSVDRDNPKLPYTEDNIVLMTWFENNKRGTDMMYSGEDDRQLRKVRQLSLDGKFIREFYSVSAAARELGIRQGNITNACVGRSKSSGGFKWEYVD